VKHVIFSTLPHAKQISGGKYHVPHFDNKANIEQHMRDIGLDSVFVSPAFYFQNWASFFPPRPNGDGTYSITLPLSPTGKIAAYDVDETGKVVSHVVKHWDQFKGQVIPLVAENILVADYVKQIATATGLNIKHNIIPYDIFKGFAGEEITEMLHYFDDFGYFGNSAEAVARLDKGNKLVGLTNFHTWAAKNAEALKAAGNKAK